MNDLRYALRMMHRSPGFTAVAALSLALGIGANTAIFSLVHTLLWRDLPVRNPVELVEPLSLYPGDPPLNFFSWNSYQHFRDRNHVFSAVTAASAARLQVRTSGTDAETTLAERVAPNFFSVLAPKMSLGRALTPEDEASTAVVSWTFWKNRLHADPNFTAQTIRVDGAPFRVVGVAAPELTGLRAGARTDLWIPGKPPEKLPWAVVARLKPGITLAQARAEMAVLYQFTIEERSAASKDPVLRTMKVDLVPARAGLTTILRSQFADPLLMLLTIVGLLLLMACSNVAGMLLARGAARRREMSIRIALGASRLRLGRQVLTEALLLSAIGGLGALLLARFGARALVKILASGRPFIDLPQVEIPVELNSQVLLFTAAIALTTGILFGLAPAWHAFAGVPADGMRGAGKSGETPFARRASRSLVAAQVAVSLVLVVAAAQFGGHLANLQRLDLGFQPKNLLLVALDPARSGYPRDQLAGPYRDLLARLEALPGVRSATISGMTPISGAAASRLITVEGFSELPEQRRYVSMNWVAPKYFATLGTPLLAGRDFVPADQGHRLAIVSQTMARHYFGAASPIGRQFAIDGDPRRYEIIGLVGDAKYYDIREPAPRTIFFHTFQEGRPASQFVLRTSVPPASLGPAVRRTARDVLKSVPIAKVTTMEEQVDATIVPERLTALLAALFGGLGGLLAAIGLYGLLAYAVARRVPEIGVRMALGATRAGVIGMVLADALRMTAAGIALGIPAALWTRRLAASVWQLERTGGPVIFGVLVLLAIALTAAYVPSRRAARVDPMDALRYE